MSRVTLVLVLFVGACTSTTPAPANDADCAQTCAPVPAAR